ncbi:MAG: hypothetical protein KBC22_00470 [Candidatus Pacebacteria bacterium]|nr:hypothetical protein [Candidatus Paceibacterota bacterium]
MEQLNLKALIAEISPLYNSYKNTSRDISGTEALLIMWDIGDILKKVIGASKIPPHNLYRKVYGKAEGISDIVQRSYITREFLGRAYRIRNIFLDKKEIKNTLPNLKSFIPFREAMPFFDNKKYMLTGENKNNLIALLNSSSSNRSILDNIKSLQSKHIGIKNPRNQKLNELEDKKQVFITFYNYLFNLIKQTDYKLIMNEISTLDKATLIKLSSATNCLSQEGLVFPEIPEDHFNERWTKYVELIKFFSTKRDPRDRRRFRRLIPPTRIVRLAEMLQAVSCEESFKNFRIIT